MILLLDVGNTRVKWAWLTSAGLSEQQAIVHRDTPSALWMAALMHSGEAPERILVSNVAGPQMATTLLDLAHKVFSVRAEFVTAALRYEELTNGYLDPFLLGADRWLALIGAWKIASSALCVVDAGTAVKVDCVDVHGQHLGGLIAPGVDMMREALMRNTGDIANAAAQSTASLAGTFANNTIAGVARGAVFALAGMADRAVEVFERSTETKPNVFVTGGDAQLVTDRMRSHAKIVPDLVLRGLASIAVQPSLSKYG